MALTETLIRNRSGSEIAPRPGVSLHFLKDEGVLFDSTRQELYAINTTATFIWCCLCDRLKEEEIAKHFAKTFNFSTPDAAAHVAHIIAHWRELRLIGEVGDMEPAAPDQLTYNVPPTAPFPGQVDSAHTEALRPDASERDCRILDLHLRLRIPSKSLREQADRLLAPMMLRHRAATLPILVELSVRNGQYVARANGGDMELCDSRSQALPMLKACLLRLAFQYSSDFAAIHAAAVGRRGRCIVMPAASGGGKSTLTAAMITSGFQFFSDDTVVLTGNNLSARSLPFSICVKRGAWELLANRFPDLKRQPIHDRPDGKEVRYLPLPHPALYPSPTESARVSAIVFLHRKQEYETALLPLPAPVALKRLLNGFHPLGNGLDNAKVSRLLRWISTTDCFELQFSSLEEGVAQLEHLCP